MRSQAAAIASTQSTREEPVMSAGILNLIIQLVSGAVGVNIAGSALKQFDLGAGSTLRALEERLYARSGSRASAGLDQTLAAGARGPVRMLDTYVRPEWIDYNGHMTDSRYLRMFTAQAATRIPTTSEIVSSAIIMSLAHGLIAETSVGLNAVAVVNDR